MAFVMWPDLLVDITGVWRVDQSEHDRQSVNSNCPHAYKHTMPQHGEHVDYLGLCCLFLYIITRATFCLCLCLKCFQIKFCSEMIPLVLLLCLVAI